MPTKQVYSFVVPPAQRLAKEVAKPFPALYIATATGEVLKAAAALSLCLISNGRAHSTSPATDAALTAAPMLCSLGRAAPTVSSSVIASSTCIWRAAAFSNFMLGLHQADACSRALSVLLQHSPAHADARLLLLHRHQHHTNKQQQHQHHQRHSVHDALRCLMFGRSAFALFKAEPSKEAWLSLLAALSAPQELPQEQPHALLLARRASGLRMQPRWVANRVTIQ